jgi:hypothetical protein
MDWISIDGRGRGRIDLAQQTQDLSLGYHIFQEHEVCDVNVGLQPAPGNRGTEVRARARIAGSRTLMRQLFQSASGTSLEQKIREYLRRLKQFLEAGEIATTNGQPHGNRGLKGKVARAIFREGADESSRSAVSKNRELAGS